MSVTNETYAAAVARIGELELAAPALLAAARLAKSALTHSPSDCWATGPATGDPIEDLIVCPGCRAIAAIDAAISKAKGIQS